MNTLNTQLEPDWCANVSSLLRLSLDQNGVWLLHLLVLNRIVVLRLAAVLHLTLSYDSQDDDILFDILSFTIENRKLTDLEKSGYSYKGGYTDGEHCIVEAQGTGCFALFVCAAFEVVSVESAKEPLTP